jgi:hypothetical protein
MSALVAPSTFSARVNETALTVDTFLASAVFFVTITDGAIAADAFVGRLLWEVINDSQTANWGGINSSQTAAWAAIDDSQSTTWHVVQTQT